MGSLEDFEKVDFEKNYIYMAIAVLGHFDPKWLFLPKLTLGPKAPPRGKQLTIYFSICTQKCKANLCYSSRNHLFHRAEYME